MNQLSTRTSGLAGRYLQALAVANGDTAAALAYVEQQKNRWGDYTLVKAAVDALSLGTVSTRHLWTGWLEATTALPVSRMGL